MIRVPRHFTNPGLWLLGLLMAPSALAVPAAPGAVRALDRELRSILEERVAKGEVHHKQALVELIELGPGSIRDFVGLYDPDAFAGDEDAPPLLTRETEALWFEAMKSWPQGDVVPLLAREGRGEELPLERRLIVIRALGEVGRGRALSSILAVIGEIDPMHLCRPYVAKKVEGALSAILRRDPSGFGRLASRMDHLEVSVLPTVARTLGQNPRPKSLELLISLLQRDGTLDAVVLKTCAKVPAWVGRGASDQGRAVVRTFALQGDARKRRLAVLALGRLHDVEAIPDLISLLEEEGRGLSEAALWSLREISGAEWPADARLWGQWHQDQIEWLRADAGRLARDLVGGDPDLAFDALRQLGGQSVFRAECAKLLKPALAASDPKLASAACSALGRLETREALGGLVEALADSRSEVSAAALEALRKSTSIALSDDRMEWSRFFSI